MLLSSPLSGGGDGTENIDDLFSVGYIVETLLKAFELSFVVPFRWRCV